MMNPGGVSNYLILINKVFSGNTIDILYLILYSPCKRYAEEYSCPHDYNIFGTFGKQGLCSQFQCNMGHSTEILLT